MLRSQLIRGVLDIAVLAVLARGESYGYEVLVTLAGHGLGDVGDASVYGTLHRLEMAGHLSSRLAASDSGPARRYYRLTAAGLRHLRSVTGEWAELRGAVDRVIDGAGTR